MIICGIFEIFFKTNSQILQDYFNKRLLQLSHPRVLYDYFETTKANFITGKNTILPNFLRPHQLWLLSHFNIIKVKQHTSLSRINEFHQIQSNLPTYLYTYPPTYLPTYLSTYLPIYWAWHCSVQACFYFLLVVVTGSNISLIAKLS